MSTGEQAPTAFIRGLKAHFGVGSDDALAEKIGVAKSTIATWRRRGTIPAKAAGQIQRKFGLTAESLTQFGNNEFRSYLLRQAFYLIIIKLVESARTVDPSEHHDERLADDLALIDPYLARAIVRAASEEKYQGVGGASAFLFGLRSGEIRGSTIAKEAMDDRKRDLGS